MADQAESSSHATKETSSRRASMNTIESSVTRLLVSTKHLLESLTQWARQKADDKFVSDAYVKLGNDFRAASRAFTNAGVDISDLGDVPKALRIVLESALSEAPTQENLDRFLPNIRNIIVNLLSNLKIKQQRAREIAEDNVISKKDSGPPTKPSSGFSSTHHSRSSPASTMSSRRSRAYPDIHVRHDSDNPEQSEATTLPSDQTNSSDALAKLQKGNFISRRASKRFSAYQFAKLANLNNNSLPRITSDSHKSPDSSFDERSKFTAGDDVPTTKMSSSNSEYLSIFMRINEVTRKVAVSVPMTLASLRLQFVEKFGYSPGIEAFPDIYVYDSMSSVWFELEDNRIDEDVKEGTLLSLHGTIEEKSNFRTMEVKLEALENRMEEFSSKMITEVKEMVNSLSVNSGVTQLQPIDSGVKSHQLNSRLFTELMREVKEVQKISNMRKKTFQVSLNELAAEIEALKSAGLEEGSKSSNRSYMQQSYSKLSEDSDNLLTKVDDLQDIMEALRKDVAQRGVRLGPKQLKNTRKEITEAMNLLDALTNYISDGKPTWKKIWEAELDKVCEEQQFFNLQDDLTSDLEEDIKKIRETFDLIEKCSLEQSKQVSSRKATFAGLANLHEPGESLHDLRDAVLSEVAALIPNHENRLEAIAKAEKLRQKEREHINVSQFQEELGDFVEDNKFKTSGGIEELERRRQEKDSENLKLSMGII